MLPSRARAVPAASTESVREGTDCLATRPTVRWIDPATSAWPITVIAVGVLG